MELQDDMKLIDALAYVLVQYDTPKWLDEAILNMAGNWERLQSGPNYGKSEHPKDWPEDDYCVCDECMRDA